MRCEFSEHEWTAIKPMLPNKPRGVRRLDDRRLRDGIVWVLRSGGAMARSAGELWSRTNCRNRFVR
jgi:transposase